MKSKIILTLLFLCLPKLGFSITENEFAYSALLETDGDTPYYELELPEFFYEKISRNDLGDVRVLNRAKQLVPHAMRSIRVQKTQHIETNLPAYYPIYHKADEKNGDLRLNIKRNTAGEVINIRSDSRSNNSVDRLSGYLIEMGEWKKPIENIKLSWTGADSKSFIQKLNISVSNDLTSWKSISTDKTLVNLNYQGHQLIEDTIKLSIEPTKYLRIMFSGNKPGIEITGMIISRTQSNVNIRQNWRSVAVSKSNIPGDYYFKFDLKSPIREIHMQLPETNTVINVKVLSRKTEEDDWLLRGTALLYRLSIDGVEIQQNKLFKSHSSDREWKLQIDQQGGGIGSAIPEIKVAWQPHKLVFVARGESPYKLLWGSARVEPVLMSASKLLVGMDGQETVAENMLGQARWLENSVSEINLKALVAVAKPLNWQQIVLWLVLVVAAFVLILMAYQLMRKMNESDAKE